MALPPRSRVAVIGAGVAGLQAGHLLIDAGAGCPGRPRGRRRPRGPLPLRALEPARRSLASHLCCPPARPAGYDTIIFEKSGNVGGVWQSNYAGAVRRRGMHVMAERRPSHQPARPCSPGPAGYALQVRKWHFVIPGYPWPDSESHPKCALPAARCPLPLRLPPTAAWCRLPAAWCR